MIAKTQLSAYGLKWNPFIQDIPSEALLSTPKIESYCYRIESLVLDGGFAMVTGDPGLGKSVLLRIISERLSKIRDLQVISIDRPQSSVADFYRELSVKFSTNWITNNRWSSFEGLREKWQNHIENSSLRPVIVIDESQEMSIQVMAELRSISSTRLDSRNIATIILAGDERLPSKLRHKDLIPIGSRIRTRFRADPASQEEMTRLLQHRLETSGNPSLMTPEVQQTLVDRSASNYRVLLNSADELLTRAMEKNIPQIDEKLFFEVFNPNPVKKGPKR